VKQSFQSGTGDPVKVLMQTLDARLVRQMQPMLEQVQADHQADQHSVPANLWSYSHNGLVIVSQSI
jgi:hypothetical protein